MRNDAWQSAQQAFLIESTAITQMNRQLSYPAFSKAVELLQHASRIATSGCGHSGVACMHMAHLLCCIGLTAKFISPSEGLHGGLGFLRTDDVLLLLSRGGETEELTAMQKAAAARNITTLAITENAASPLALNATAILPLSVSRECDHDNCQGTTSFIVSCALFDALQSALIEEMHYSSHQFAAIHPGGAVGKRLNQNTNGGDRT